METIPIVLCFNSRIRNFICKGDDGLTIHSEFLMCIAHFLLKLQGAHAAPFSSFFMQF